MIKLKDLIKEEHCECGGGCCSTKEQVIKEMKVSADLTKISNMYGANQEVQQVKLQLHQRHIIC